jgi:3',5'-cyclic AMP phosphodiesterase CpdA
MLNEANTKPIVVIGDVHGLTNWKDVVKRHRGSMFVFLGDYCDPYEDIEPDALIKNFRSIVLFKKKHPKDVILLLGNHDMHYISEDIVTSTRYDNRMASRMKRIIYNNRDLFQYAWQYGNMLFTHAGVNDQWFHEDFIGSLDGKRSVAEQLNHPTPEQFSAMGQVSWLRGGPNENGGIFWADKYETSQNPLKGYIQFVGHSRVNNIKQVKLDENTSITYCDCLFNNQYLVINRQNMN